MIDASHGTSLDHIQNVYYLDDLRLYYITEAHVLFGFWYTDLQRASRSLTLGEGHRLDFLLVRFFPSHTSDMIVSFFTLIILSFLTLFFLV